MRALELALFCSEGNCLALALKTTGFYSCYRTGVFYIGMTKRESIEVCRRGRKLPACSLHSLGAFQRIPTASAVFHFLPSCFLSQYSLSSFPRSHNNTTVKQMQIQTSHHTEQDNQHGHAACNHQSPSAFSHESAQRFWLKRRLERRLLAVSSRFSTSSGPERPGPSPKLPWAKNHARQC
jgi:hypothetical protein